MSRNYPKTKEEKEKIAKQRISMAIMELEAANEFIKDTDLSLVHNRISMAVLDVSNILTFMEILVPS